MKKQIIVFCACLLFLTGMIPYNESDVTVFEGETTADRLNVRTGPGVMYPIIASLSKNTRLRILGSLKGWLVVLLPDDSVGMVCDRYVLSYEPASEVSEGSDLEEDITIPLPMEDFVPDAQRLFSLVNEYRVVVGVPPYKWDDRLNEAARLKAEDMAENKYFGHDSPAYGTPFAMLKNLGVFYKTASENLACTADVRQAFEKMKGNLAHRTNLISKRYTNMGTAAADSPDEPGKKIIVLLFTEE